MINYKTLYTETKELSVLFVEDYEALRQEMSQVLEDLFKEVTCASNGKEALSIYDSKEVDLVISDIQMPLINGVTLSEEIRKKNKEQAIIIISAHTDSEYLLDLINIGISKFLIKPIEHDALFKILYDESKKINRLKESVVEPIIVNLGEGYYWNREIEILKHNDKIVELTKHELLLLQFFLLKKDYICTNVDIITDFYNKNIDLSEKNIRNLVFRLRKKIPENCITNVYGLGYKFTL